MNRNNTETGRKNPVRWIARIWSIPVILYVLIIAVGYLWNWVTTGKADPYAVENVSLLESLPPVFILLSTVGLGFAWRWERIGGWAAVILQIAVLVLLLITKPLTADFSRFVIPYIVLLAAAAPAVLFVISGYRTAHMKTV